MTEPATRTIDQHLHEAFAWLLTRLPRSVERRVRRWTGGRFGIGTQIIVGLGGGVLLTVAVVVVAMGLMGIIDQRQTEIAEQYMPDLVSAFDVVRQSAELVRATPQMVSAADSDALESVAFGVLGTENVLRTALARITGAESMDDVAAQRGLGAQILPLVDSLVTVLYEIRESVDRRMAYSARIRELDEELAGVGLELQLQVEQEIDDQHFFMYTGYRELNGSATAVGLRRTEAEIDHYAGLLNFKAYQNEATAQMAQAIAETDLGVLQATGERTVTALSDVESSMARIRQAPRLRLEALVNRLRDLNSSNGGIQETRRGELTQLALAEELVGLSNEITAELEIRVEGLVAEASSSAEAATGDSSRVVSLGFWTMMLMAIVTVAFAWFTWRFVGERLVVRVGSLARATHRMSKGDLDVKVRIEGDDEVTDMAGALEVFRQHAVEVQRLNLVENLAAEVQAKNDTLEETLDNLRRTQQQVIKQEKLASLGALTAGIAHEIRNPLNFVNNFAALSRELITELREEIHGEEGADDPPEEMDREYIEEILTDLDTNVKKVNEHGERANRIVDGMLSHSRDEAGQVEAVDLNLMVAEYTKLAYHGMRGADSTFNVDMVKEFDPTVGEVEAIARDLSRVFLNVVTNACHATQARKQKMGEDEEYFPTVTVRTSGDEESVRVQIHDNGTGIPPDIVNRIFDPFFTTKAGTGGTGLGLSISNEIIEEHGGKLEVNSEPGEFTEFTITLPRKGPLSTGIGA